MKSIQSAAIFLSLNLFIFGCATVTPVAKNLQKTGVDKSVKITEVNIGPNEITKGKVTYTPLVKSQDMIHVTLEITNTSTRNMDIDFSSIKLALINSEGSLSPARLSPAYYRFYPVGLTTDIADDARTATGGDASKSVTLNPSNKVERTLIYLLDKKNKPAKIIFANDKNLEIDLK